MTADAMPKKGDRSTCRTCGMTAVTPIVVAKQCTNAAACAKRVRVATKGEAERAKSAPRPAPKSKTTLP
jgi:hypothetical protein